jgi:hypothetical protein
MVAGTGALEGGGMWGEDAAEHGVANANAGSAIGLGLVSGLSETVSPGGMLIKRIAGVRGISPVTDKVADTFLKRLGTEIPKAMGGEAAQEVFQSFLGILNKKIQDPTVSLTDREAIHEYINSGAAGAAGGLLFGGASAAFPEGQAQTQPAAPPIIDELPPEHTVDDVLDNHNAKTAVETAVAREGIQNAAGPDMTANTVGGVLGQVEPGSNPSVAAPADVSRLFTHIQDMALSLHPKPDEDGKTELPAWVKIKTLKDYDKETGEGVTSVVNSRSAKETLQAVLSNEPLTEKQSKVWSYLKGVAENRAMVAEQGTDTVSGISNLAEDAKASKSLIPSFDPAKHLAGLGNNSPYAPGSKEETGPLGEAPPMQDEQAEPDTHTTANGTVINKMTGEVVKSKEDKTREQVIEEGDRYPLLADTPNEGGDYQQGGAIAGSEAIPALETGTTAEPLPEPSTPKHEVINNTDSVAHGQEMNTNPSEAQKEAENYSMAHVKVDGFDVSIENPAGSTRKGKSPDGKEWESKMMNDYGRIKGTVGYDKDHVDVFFKAGYQGGADTVHIVNQVNQDGTFDEHKVVMGAGSAKAAMGLYNVNYEKGWTGGKSVVSMPVAEFKEWVKGEGPSKGELAGGETFSNTHQEYTEAGEIVANDLPSKPVDDQKTENINDNTPDIIEHTTKKGKSIKGIVRTDITLAEAKEIDKYTFRKDGGFFIREKHLKALEPTSAKSGEKTPESGQKVEDKEEKETDSYHSNDGMNFTDGFNQWFGNSKIVDESGNPLIVFHGTDKQFESFNENEIGSNSGNSGFLGKGFYFSKEKSIALAYGKVKEVYLSIKKPFTITKPLTEKEADILNEASQTYAFDKGNTPDEVYSGLSHGVAAYPDISETLRDGLVNAGYDGVVLVGYKKDEIVAFSPQQIRLAEESKTDQELTNPKPEPKAVKEPEKDIFANNTAFTSDAVKKARERLKAKRNTLSAGFDPELMQDVFIIGGAYFEAGIKNFTEWSKTVLDDIGKEFKEFLPGTYENLRRYPGIDTEGMTPTSEVDSILSGKKEATEPKKETNDLDTATAELKALDTEIEQLYQLRECLSA